MASKGSSKNFFVEKITFLDIVLFRIYAFGQVQNILRQFKQECNFFEVPQQTPNMFNIKAKRDSSQATTKMV